MKFIEEANLANKANKLKDFEKKRADDIKTHLPKIKEFLTSNQTNPIQSFRTYINKIIENFVDSMAMRDQGGTIYGVWYDFIEEKGKELKYTHKTVREDINGVFVQYEKKAKQAAEEPFDKNTRFIMYYNKSVIRDKKLKDSNINLEKLVKISKLAKAYVKWLKEKIGEEYEFLQKTDEVKGLRWLPWKEWQSNILGKTHLPKSDGKEHVERVFKELLQNDDDKHPRGKVMAKAAFLKEKYGERPGVIAYDLWHMINDVTIAYRDDGANRKISVDTFKSIWYMYQNDEDMIKLGKKLKAEEGKPEKKKESEEEEGEDKYSVEGFWKNLLTAWGEKRDVYELDKIIEDFTLGNAKEFDKKFEDMADALKNEGYLSEKGKKTNKMLKGKKLKYDDKKAKIKKLDENKNTETLDLLQEMIDNKEQIIEAKNQSGGAIIVREEDNPNPPWWNIWSRIKGGMAHETMLAFQKVINMVTEDDTISIFWKEMKNKAGFTENNGHISLNATEQETIRKRWEDFFNVESSEPAGANASPEIAKFYKEMTLDKRDEDNTKKIEKDKKEEKKLEGEIDNLKNLKTKLDTVYKDIGWENIGDVYEKERKEIEAKLTKLIKVDVALESVEKETHKIDTKSIGDSATISPIEHIELTIPFEKDQKEDYKNIIKLNRIVEVMDLAGFMFLQKKEDTADKKTLYYIKKNIDRFNDNFKKNVEKLKDAKATLKDIQSTNDRLKQHIQENFDTYKTYLTGNNISKLMFKINFNYIKEAHFQQYNPNKSDVVEGEDKKKKQ